MTLTLTGVTKENSQLVSSLSTNPDGIITDEDPFIDSNRTMLLRAAGEPGWMAKLIMLNEQPIGLTIYGFHKSSRHLELVHFMIDHRFQNHGYGRLALELILQEMDELAPHQSIYLAIHYNNEHAHHLYASFGFTDTNIWMNKFEKMMIRYANGFQAPHLALNSVTIKRTA